MQSIRFLMLMATMFLSATRLRADIAMTTDCPDSPPVLTSVFFFKAGPSGGSCLFGHNASPLSWSSMTIITAEVAGKTSLADYPCDKGVSVPFSVCDVHITPGPDPTVEFFFSGGSGISNVGPTSEFGIDLRTHPLLTPGDFNAPGMWGDGHLFEAVANGGAPLPLDTPNPELPLNPPSTVPEPSSLSLLILVIGALIACRFAGNLRRETTWPCH